MSIRMKIIVKFDIRISKLNLKEKQRYYLKQYMEFSTKYRFVRLTLNYPENFKSRLEMNWKEQEKIVSKSQMNSLMLSNFFRDKFQNSMPKVRNNSLTIIYRDNGEKFSSKLPGMSQAISKWLNLLFTILWSYYLWKLFAIINCEARDENFLDIQFYR